MCVCVCVIVHVCVYHLQAPGAKLRRKLVCDALGIDPCTGKSLANVLNRFFHRHELEAAMKRVSSAVGASDDSVDQAA